MNLNFEKYCKYIIEHFYWAKILVSKAIFILKI